METKEKPVQVKKYRVKYTEQELQEIATFSTTENMLAMLTTLSKKIDKLSLNDGVNENHCKAYRVNGFTKKMGVPNQVSQLAKYSLHDVFVKKLENYLPYFSLIELRILSHRKTLVNRVSDIVETITELTKQFPQQENNITDTITYEFSNEKLLANREIFSAYFSNLYMIYKIKKDHIVPTSKNLMNRAELVYPLLTKVNDLYVTSRKNYIQQVSDGHYLTQQKPLTDYNITSHLEGRTTIGVFSGTQFTKFFTFDIDMQLPDKIEKARTPLAQKKQLDMYQKHEMRRIIYYLTKELGIDKSAILLSKSGNKGYHVDVFIKDLVDVQCCKNIYIDMLEELEVKTHEIEFRPTKSQGVKLPIGLNRNTNVYCNLVDMETMEECSEAVMLDVVPMNTDEFIEIATVSYERLIRENVTANLDYVKTIKPSFYKQDKELAKANQEFEGQEIEEDSITIAPHKMYALYGYKVSVKKSKFYDTITDRVNVITTQQQNLLRQRERLQELRELNEKLYLAYKQCQLNGRVVKINGLTEIILDNMTFAEFKETIQAQIAIVEENIEELEEQAKELETQQIKKGQVNSQEKECVQMLNTRLLPTKSSRHNATILLIAYLVGTLNKSKSETLAILDDIFRNTIKKQPERMGSTLEFANKEANRVFAYAKSIAFDIELNNRALYKNDSIKYFTSELNKIKTLPKNLQKLAFALLTHSKIYALSSKASFYLTYAQLAEYGITGNRSRILKSLKKLDAMGLIGLSQSTEFKKSNSYNVKFASDFGQYTFVNVTELLGKGVSTQLISSLLNRVEEPTKIIANLPSLTSTNVYNTPMMDYIYLNFINKDTTHYMTKAVKVINAIEFISFRMVNKEKELVNSKHLSITLEELAKELNIELVYDMEEYQALKLPKNTERIVLFMQKKGVSANAIKELANQITSYTIGATNKSQFKYLTQEAYYQDNKFALDYSKLYSTLWKSEYLTWRKEYMISVARLLTKQNETSEKEHTHTTI